MAKLREQFRIKYFSQLAAVSYGVDKIKQGGSIVLTTGSLSRRPGKGSSALAGCNAALEVMIKGLANDFGPKVRINCVSPGVTDTEIWDSMPPEVKAGMLAGFGSRVPLGRAGTIEDVGNAIALLLLAEWTTGCTLDCDGGATIRP